MSRNFDIEESDEIEDEEEGTTHKHGERRFSQRGAGARGRRRMPQGGRQGRRRTNYCPDGKCFDYKNVETLRHYVSETGKIKPRRQTGNCARCQRELAREIKRARHLALLPFVSAGE